MKKYLILLVLFISYFINLGNISAGHQCQYSLTQNSKTVEFIITYDDDRKVTVSSQNWFDSDIMQNLTKAMAHFVLVDYDDLNNSSPLLTESVNKALDEDSCPGLDNEVYVCTGTSFSVEPLKPVTSALEFVVDLFHPIWTEGVTFSSYFETLGNDLSGVVSLMNVKNSLVIAGSKRDAQQTYGYFDGNGFDINWDGLWQANEELDLGYRWGSMECGRLYYLGDKKTFNLNCPYLTDISNDYTSALDAYSECGENDENCKRNNLEIIKPSEDKLKQYCKSIISNQDYYLTDEDEEKKDVNDCMKECLDLSKNIYTLRKQAGLDVNGTGACGFSDRLLAWIYNIIKWIKYIIPSIVIVLGILDFIKAIASDKDDEMKKAQGRFIKRLIAAALIFIVPFIIEYILDVFNFIDKTCGMF